MVQKSVLPCGLTIVSERFPQFPSVALSYSLKSGSRAESEARVGFHHFIEHMLFKGSERYSLKRIADISDRLGGRLNAFTGKEITQFHIKAIDEKLPDAFLLLSDLVMNATFPADEFLRERDVIIQEIKESEDNPDTCAFERFYERVYDGNALGWPIGGRQSQVAGFTRDQVHGFYRRLYRPDNLLLAAAGSIEHARLVDMAASFFAAWPDAPPQDLRFDAPRFQAARFQEDSPSLNQSYVIVGFDSIPAASPQRHAFMVFNDILGAGMSSRLFQKIREEKGLAYTISSFADPYLDCGLLCIYGVVEGGRAVPYLQAVAAELQQLRRDGVSAEELDRAKDHIKSSIVLSLENNVAKMRFNINQELFFKQEQTVRDIIAAVGAVSRDEIDRLCATGLDPARAAVFVYGRTGEALPDFAGAPALQ